MLWWQVKPRSDFVLSSITLHHVVTPVETTTSDIPLCCLPIAGLLPNHTVFVVTCNIAVLKSKERDRKRMHDLVYIEYEILCVGVGFELVASWKQSGYAPDRGVAPIYSREQ